MKKGKLIKRIITFIGSFLAALSVVAQFFPEAFSFLSVTTDMSKIVFVFVIIMMLGLFFINWKQSMDENEQRLRIEHESTHKYAHLLRDTTYEIEKIGKGKRNEAAMNHLLISFTNGVVNCVKETLCAIMNADAQKNDITVCVKVLDYKYWDNSKIEDKDAATYKTISRSFTPKGALQVDDAVFHPISSCTPFHRIFTEGKHDWTGLKLNSPKNIEIISEDEANKGFVFTDSCANWSEYYAYKIVVPIRVKLSEIDDKYLDSDERNLFGFLCIEYKKKSLLQISHKFDEELISILDLMKTYADTMYIVYDKAYKYIGKGKSKKDDNIHGSARSNRSE